MKFALLGFVVSGLKNNNNTATSCPGQFTQFYTYTIYSLNIYTVYSLVFFIILHYLN